MATPEPEQSTAARYAWMKHAACINTGPDLFFIERGASSAPAKEVCAACSVTADCLDYALANNEIAGIYGGLTVKERAKVRRRRLLQVITID